MTITGLIKRQLTKNLCYVVLDRDEHDGKLCCDLEDKKHTWLMGWRSGLSLITHMFRAKEAKPLCSLINTVK